MLTTDHQTIKDWVKKYHGTPQSIDDPQAQSDKLGLRIDFPGPQDEALISGNKDLKIISWPKFFVIFEKQGLAFQYEDPAQPEPSLAYRFVKRDVIKDEDDSLNLTQIENEMENM